MTGYSLGDLAICALAVFRAWRIIAIDDMPLLVTVREWALGTTHVTPEITHHRRATLAHLVNCPWCLGSYLSLGAFALARFSPGVAVWVLGVLAVGALAGLIVRNLDPVEE